jgi:hypothetical protein
MSSGVQSSRFAGRDAESTHATIGIQLDLAELNDGPFRVNSMVITHVGNFTLYFQACERMDCPPGYQCNPKELSFASVCNDMAAQCEAPRWTTTPPTALSSRTSGLWLHCLPDEVARGNILWDGIGSVSANHMVISAAAQEVYLASIVLPTNRVPSPSRPAGWNAVVKAGSRHSLLLYESCGCLACPTGAHCQGSASTSQESTYARGMG